MNNIHNETNPIITTISPIRDKEDETKKAIIYICPSYIQELADKDNFSFEVIGPNKKEGIDFTTYIISTNVPKLEISLTKKGFTRSRELDQIRENAVEEYQEQLTRECNIIEKQLMENSINYYVNELYGKLKSNIESDKNFKIVDYSVKDTGIILETDGPTTGNFFNSIENSSNSFEKLKPYDYMRYINFSDNPIIYIQSENGKWIVRLSYLRELAEKDELDFEVRDIYGDKIIFYLIKQNLPKLELPKHKVLSIKD